MVKENDIRFYSLLMVEPTDKDSENVINIYHLRIFEQTQSQIHVEVVIVEITASREHTL